MSSSCVVYLIYITYVQEGLYCGIQNQ